MNYANLKAIMADRGYHASEGDEFSAQDHSSFRDFAHHELGVAGHLAHELFNDLEGLACRLEALLGIDVPDEEKAAKMEALAQAKAQADAEAKALADAQAEQAAQEQARLAAEQAAADEAARLAAEQAETERLAKEEADRLAVEQAAKEEADRIAADQQPQDENQA